MSEAPSYDFLNPPPTVLEFRYVTFDPGEDYRAGFERLNFTLRPGELMLIWHDPKHGPSPIADAAQGLCVPVEGSVVFRGEDWQAQSARRADRMRQNTGRVYSDVGWSPDQDLHDHLMEPLRGRRFTSKTSGIRELESLARLVGLDPLQGKFAHELPIHDQQRAQWIRAFLGRPGLVILEHPVSAGNEERMEALGALIDEARSFKAGVIWITCRKDVWDDPPVAVDQRYVVEGSILRAHTE